MKGVRKLAPYLRPYYKTIAVMVILGVFSSLADSIYPLFTSYALDTFVAGKTLRGIVPFSLLYLLLMAVTEAVNYYCLYKCGVVEMKVDRDLRNASFNHLQTLSFSYFNQNNVGYIHARVMSDTGKIGELVAWRLMDFVWEASYILFVIVMMLAINVRLAAWTLLIVPAGVLIITYFQRRLVEGNRKIREINRIPAIIGLDDACKIYLLFLHRFSSFLNLCYRYSAQGPFSLSYLIPACFRIDCAVISLISLWCGI